MNTEAQEVIDDALHILEKENVLQNRVIDYALARLYSWFVRLIGLQGWHYLQKLISGGNNWKISWRMIFMKNWVRWADCTSLLDRFVANIGTQKSEVGSRVLRCLYCDLPLYLDWLGKGHGEMHRIKNDDLQQMIEGMT